MIRLAKEYTFTELGRYHIYALRKDQMINISQNLCCQTDFMLVAKQHHIPKEFNLISSFEGPMGFQRKTKRY